jgi:hypothetical protein
MFIPSQSMWEIHRQLYQQRLSRTADTQMSMPLVARPRFAASPEVVQCCQASLSGTA